MLNSNKKLVKSEVEESEDLIREVNSDIIRDKWLQGRGGGGGGAKVVQEKPVEKESDVQNCEEENANSVDEEKPVESDVRSPTAQQVGDESLKKETPETPNTKTDFIEESPEKIHLSSIINKLEEDENDTGEGEKEQGKNDADKENDEDEVKSEGEKSNEHNTSGPGKTENAEQSPVNTVHDILVRGVSANLVDNEENR